MTQVATRPTKIHSPEIYQKSFTAFIAHYIALAKSGKIVTKKDERYSDETLKCYKMFQDWFKEFEAYKDREAKKELPSEETFKFMLRDIDFAIGEEFKIFLINETKLSKNSIRLVVSKLKAVLRYAFKKGWTLWNGSGLEVAGEISTQTYLTTTEMKTMKSTELTKSERRVLEIQIIQAFTGLRNQTLKKFLAKPLSYIKESRGQNYIDIIEDKTGKQSIIPIGGIVTEILGKYKGKIQVPTPQYINRVIKVIAQKAGLTNDIVVRKTVNGIVEESFSPKFMKISTHTSRRTLISLMTEYGFQASEIMPISGHATEKQMNNYVKLENVTKVQHLFGDNFFNTTLDDQDSADRSDT